MYMFEYQLLIINTKCCKLSTS